MDNDYQIPKLADFDDLAHIEMVHNIFQMSINFIM